MKKVLVFYLRTSTAVSHSVTLRQAAWHTLGINHRVSLVVKHPKTLSWRLSI